jgi:hypothetical protein
MIARQSSATWSAACNDSGIGSCSTQWASPNGVHYSVFQSTLTYNTPKPASAARRAMRRRRRAPSLSVVQGRAPRVIPMNPSAPGIASGSSPGTAVPSTRSAPAATAGTSGLRPVAASRSRRVPRASRSHSPGARSPRGSVPARAPSRAGTIGCGVVAAASRVPLDRRRDQWVSSS